MSARQGLSMACPEQRRRVFRRPLLLLLALALAVATLAAACVTGPVAGDPALPPGFAEAGLPDVDLNAYVYLAQESPTVIPLRVFGSSVTLPPGAPTSGNVRWLLAFMGPTVEDFGGRVLFGDEATARVVDQTLKSSTSDQSLWYQVEGPRVNIVRSAAPWAQDARAALEQARTASVKDKYPDAWETMRLLPSEAPNARPVAAGFVRNVTDMVKPILDRQGADGAAISSALSFAKVENVAFAVYSDRQLQLPPEVTDQYLKSLDVGAIVVARAGYPGFITSFLFGNFAGKAGLEDVEVEGEKVKYRALDGDLHLMVKNFGNVFYFTVGTTREATHDMMKSIIQNMRA